MTGCSVCGVQNESLYQGVSAPGLLNATLSKGTTMRDAMIVLLLLLVWTEKPEAVRGLRLRCTESLDMELGKKLSEFSRAGRFTGVEREGDEGPNRCSAQEPTSSSSRPRFSLCCLGGLREAPWQPGKK